MRLLCVFKIMLLLLFSLIGISHAKEQPGCVSLYYHDIPPKELFYAFDWLVLDPDGVSKELLKDRKAVVFGYVSLGESVSTQMYFKEIKPDWILGKNEYWGSHVMDMRNEDYRKFLMKSVIHKAIEKGFDGIFFDTLDSYHLALKGEKEKSEYEHALAGFIRKVKETYPNIKIITNRGFEIVDRIAPYIDAFLAEGLFQKLDTKAEKANYIPVGEDDRRWLLERLNMIKRKGIPVIVVDYINPKDRKGARELVGKINNLGFIPYVSNKELNIIGYSNCELLPRRVLLLYDAKQVGDAATSPIHRLTSMPLEYLGFVPDMWDISKGLPQGFLGDRYAGVILWADGELKNHEEFYAWVREKIEEGIRMIFINSFGFPMEGSYLKPLGVEVIESRAKEEKNEIIYKDNIIGFEIEPLVSPLERILKPAKGNPLVVFKNSKGQESVPLALTEWGAYALFDTFVRTVSDHLYVVDPFEFFKRALRPEFPAVPDITTENGRRILIAHIDGDGFMEKTDWNREIFASEAIRDDILKLFKMPHTVSVIEGEIAPWGLYPQLSGRLEEIAKSIFRLGNVEIASHSYSHPFRWDKLHKGEQQKYDNLPIKGYVFDLKRDITGSVDYIDTRLAPEDKKTKVFLWTGNCLAPADALKITYGSGLLNMNGGETMITKLQPFLSYIFPMGIGTGGYFRAYAPVQNENLYTNLWKGPYYGYINVIQTFELTEKPKRLKPINIYYHMYSGSKRASIKALKDVYKWALSQETNAMFASDFIRKVLDFRDMTIVRRGDKWVIRGNGELKTLRMEDGWPNIERSKGVVGYKKNAAGVYIHLDGSGDYSLAVTEKEKSGIALHDANGRVVNYKRAGNSLHLELKSYTPLEFSLVNTEGCALEIKTDATYSREVKPGKVSFRFKEGLSAYAEATCKDKF